MEQYIFLFPLILLPTVGLILFRLYWRTRRRAPEEAGKKPLVETTCGGVVGLWFYRGPFIRVSVYPDFMVIAAKKPWVFPKGSFSVEPRKRIIGKSYLIRHQHAEAPKKIDLWLTEEVAKSLN